MYTVVMNSSLLLLLNTLSYSGVRTLPPFSTPGIMPVPKTWDTRDIKLFFWLYGDNRYCNLTNVFFCDPNRMISEENSRKIISVSTKRTPEQVNNATSRCLSIGVAVIYAINVIAQEGAIHYMYIFNGIIHNMWETMRSECNYSSIMLFVSCKDSYVYETLGPNTLSTIDSRCKYVFDKLKPFYNNNSDCYSGLIESRIETYKQLLDGTHQCYRSDNRLLFILIFVVVLVVLIVIAIVIYCRYRYLLRRIHEIRKRLLNSYT